MLPFKDQKSANAVRHQLSDLSRKMDAVVQPVYVSKKIKGRFKPKEHKPAISIFIIDCIFKRIQKFLLFNLKMTVERSKRRLFVTLTFIVKSVSKNLLIRILT